MEVGVVAMSSIIVLRTGVTGRAELTWKQHTLVIHRRRQKGTGNTRAKLGLLGL